MGVDEFMTNLTPAGPELHRGFVTLVFFRKVKSGVLWTTEEKVVWEEWILPLLVNTAPPPAMDERIQGTPHLHREHGLVSGRDRPI